jgi:hypothetical protein
MELRHSYAISAGTVGVALGEADVKDATSFDTLAQAFESPGTDAEGLAADETMPLDPEITLVAGVDTDSVAAVVIGQTVVVSVFVTTTVETPPVAALVALPVG